MRKDPRVWSVAVVAAVALAAGTAAGDRTPTSSASARIAAHRILTDLRLPAGATRTSAAAVPDVLRRPPVVPATPDLVDLHAYWVVPGGPKSVLAWVTAHRPRGSKPSEQGQTGVDGRVTSGYLGLSLL